MIDYCKNKVSVAARILHFINMQLDREEEKSFNSFEDFNKWIKKTCKRKIGFNENKQGYLETLTFAYSLIQTNNNKKEE